MSEIEIKLKPCPFCGGKAKLKKGFPYQQNRRAKFAFVQCTNCRAKSGTHQQYPFEAYEDMIKFTVRDWNERAERHGHNADMSGDRNNFLCSKCGIFIKLKAYNATEEIDFDTKFCPNCGAKMDREGGDKK